MRTDARGFTLIEMVVVVLMVSILASAAMPLATLHKRRTQEADLRQALRTLRGAIDAYKHACDQGRIEKKEGESGYPPNLDVLVKGVADVSSPQGARIYFLRRLPRDPMADDASIPAAATWGLRSYASPPDAPMPGKDVFDIYPLEEGLAIDGTSYREW
ncbi:MAG: type II secretion system protein [Rubrivivax sp.]|nr:MAG: type II secretion system protein [Rubrivivax sp.]